VNDRELLARILELDELEEGRLGGKERAAFESMREQVRELSSKQVDWIRGVAERLGIQAAPARNVFSEMAPDKRAEQLRQAARVKLPHEQPGYVKATRPPGRRT
jgi:hypothetical protein